MQEIIVQWRLDIGSSARGDGGEVEICEVHTERFVVPKTLHVEAKNAQRKRGEANCYQRYKPIDAAQTCTPVCAHLSIGYHLGQNTTRLLSGGL